MADHTIPTPGTPLPWRLSQGQPDNVERVFAEGCLRDSWCRDPICSEQDAAYIVTACNLFPELVEALQDMRALALIKYGNLDPDANVLLAKASAVLAKAGA